MVERSRLITYPPSTFSGNDTGPATKAMAGLETAARYRHRSRRRVQRYLLWPLVFVIYLCAPCYAVDDDVPDSPAPSVPLAQGLHSDLCASSSSNCTQCLRQPQCAWCTQEDFPRGMSRCNPASVLLDIGCLNDSIEDPQSRIINETLVDETRSDVQLQPSVVRMALRPGSGKTFTVRYRQDEDYPVDLYYLMDLTYSMKNHKDKLAELADDLVASMLNVTKNFRLGFGSFIDKVVMPYVDMTPARLLNPCHDIQCEPPYGFHHKLPLTTNSTVFTVRPF